MTVIEMQTSIQAIFPGAVYLKNYTLRVDASGNAQIDLWNNTIGPQPTAEQLQAEADAIALEVAKSTRANELINAYKAARYGAPITITTETGSSITFPTDLPTQTNVVGYLTAYDSADWPAEGVPLQACDKSVSMIAYTHMKALAKAIAAQSQAAWKTLTILVTQVNEASTVDAVNAINWKN